MRPKNSDIPARVPLEGLVDIPELILSSGPKNHSYKALGHIPWEILGSSLIYTLHFLSDRRSAGSVHWSRAFRRIQNSRADRSAEGRGGLEAVFQYQTLGKSCRLSVKKCEKMTTAVHLALDSAAALGARLASSTRAASRRALQQTASSPLSSLPRGSYRSGVSYLGRGRGGAC